MTDITNAISGISGSTSLACWIVLLVPQLIEQWRLKSSDGIAIGFISIWFLGDVFNLIGSIWAGLLIQVVSLAVWFCIADFLMIFSFVYYKYIYVKKEEERPLMDRRRRTSSTLTDIALEPSYHGIIIKYVLPILFVFACGLLGFFISMPNSKDPEIPENPPNPPNDQIALGPQLIGYLSAFLYLGARIPQIIQNHQRKSVQGLSLLFFLFSTFGNLTYAAQILFYRSDWNYIVLNLSWLLGSLGTIFEDSIIFLQFYVYKDNDHAIEHEENEHA